MLNRVTVCFLVVLLAAAASLVAAEGDNVQMNTDGTPYLQNEESMVINPLDPDNVIAIWRDFRLNYRRIGVGTTFDGGETWSDSLLAGTPYMRHSDPVISYSSEGDIYACCLSYDNGVNYNGLFIWPSSDGGATWGDAITVVDGQFGAFEDKQWINVDRTGGEFHGQIYVPWARFTDVTHIMLCYSVDTPVGPLFTGPVQVSDQTNVQWPTVTCGSDGTVYVAWVSFANQAILIDKSINGGASFGIDQVVTYLDFYYGGIDGGITTFAFPAMEADITGGIYDNTLYIVHPDWVSGNGLDMFLIKSTDNGSTWSERVKINDDPSGQTIDQFHQWLAVNEDGILTAVWYDRRMDPANLYFDLYMSHSFDAGATWTANRRITDVSSSPFNAIFAENPTLDQPTEPKKPGWIRNPERGHQTRAGLIGEYVGLSTLGDKASTCWTDTRNGQQDVFGTRVTIGFAAPPPFLPSDGEVTSEPKPTFTWGKTGATPAEIANFPTTIVQPLHYVLEIDDDAAFFSVDYVDSSLTSTSLTLATGLTDGTWYWRVSAVNDSDRATGYFEDFRTLTVDAGIPALPTLVEPEFDEVVSFETQAFLWSPVDKGDRGTEVKYELQISSDSTFGASEINEPGLSMHTYETSGVLAPDMTYYWRVRPYDLAGNSPGFTGFSVFHTAKDYVCGDADGNELVNISDAVYLIDFIFGGGPAPDPLVAGDADCNGLVNISDAVYLISYIFGGGPAPCAACP